MRKAFIALSLLFTLGSSAQSTMSQVFKTMPSDIVPYLSENNRLDLIDFVASNMKAEVTNMFDGKTKLTKLTDDEASIQLNDAVKMDLRLLNTSDTIGSAKQIICMIRTYSNGACGSQVSFYTTEWKRLKTEDFVNLPNDIFIAEFESQSNDISLVLTLNHPLDKVALEEQKESKKLLMKYNWNSKDFKEG